LIEESPKKIEEKIPEKNSIEIKKEMLLKGEKFKSFIKKYDFLQN